MIKETASLDIGQPVMEDKLTIIVLHRPIPQFITTLWINSSYQMLNKVVAQFSDKMASFLLMASASI